MVPDRKQLLVTMFGLPWRLPMSLRLKHILMSCAFSTSVTLLMAPMAMRFAMFFDTSFPMACGAALLPR